MASSETKTIYIGAINAQATLSSVRSGADVVFTVSWRIWTDGNYSVNYRTLKFTYFIGGAGYTKTVVDNEARSEQTGSFSFTGTGRASGTKGVAMELSGSDYYKSGTVRYTLHTSWDAQTFTVSFNANGGSAPSVAGKTVSYGSAYGTLATCARSGYGFAGWYTAAEGGTKITSGTTVSITANQTLYAHWIGDAQTLTFDSNGGVCSEDSRAVATGAAYGVLPAATRAGYTFAGWYTSRTGGAQVTASTVMVAGGAAVYAHWTARSYTITFNANGGTTPTASKSVTYDQPFGALPTPTRNGYAFLGWFTAAADGAQIKATDTVKITNDRTYFAQWKPLSILHLVSGGTVTTVTTIKVTEENTVKNVIGVYYVAEGVVKQGI